MRFDYERGAQRGTYWGRRGAPQSAPYWRTHLIHPTPPPTCEEPIVNYSPGRASELRSQETNTTGSSSLALLPTDCDRDDEHNGGLGSVPTRADFGAMSPGAWVQPVPWEEPGGDSLLSAVIKLVQPTEWFRDCKSRSDGKVRMWDLVATHLPGRTATECQERWVCLNRATAESTSS